MQKLVDFTAFLDACAAVRAAPGLASSDVLDAHMAAYSIYSSRAQDDRLKAVALKVVHSARPQEPDDDSRHTRGRRTKAAPASS